MINYKKIRQLKKRYKRYRRLGKKYRIVPVEPWAFIRVKNEIKTLKACLESIKPVIKKGVIAYHKLSENEFDDGTESYITEFCKKILDLYYINMIMRSFQLMILDIKLWKKYL